MNFNFLSPVSDAVLAHNELLAQQSLGKKIKIHSQQKGVPDLNDTKLVIIGVQENRNDINYMGEALNFDSILSNRHTSRSDNFRSCTTNDYLWK